MSKLINSNYCGFGSPAIFGREDDPFTIGRKKLLVEGYALADQMYRAGGSFQHIG